MGQCFPKDLHALQKIGEMIAAFCHARMLDDRTCFALNLAAEEIFTNFIKYTPESSHDVQIDLWMENGKVFLELVAVDVNEFDLTRQPPVDVSQRLEDRRPGGLGLHLVRQMMDEIRYEYRDRQSKITLIKTTEA